MSDVVKVKISGLNLLRIIDKLVSKNVLVHSLVVKKTTITFSIDESKLPILDKICKNERKFYKILYKNGLKQFFYRLPYMLGTIIVCLIMFIYFFTTSLFIGKVNVSYISDDAYDLSKVQAILRENNIVPGQMKNKYKVSDIQKMIMLEVDDVENCVVKFSGQNLDIVIFPLTLKYEVSKENIVSKFDGVIESAEAYSGNLKVKPGDLVKKGDILIENDNGANGKIIAKVYFSATKIYNENQQELIYTGRTFETRDYVFCNFVKMFDKKICNFNSYLVEKCSFFVNKNYFLPILCNKTLYREIEIKNVVVPFESVKEKIKQELLENAKRKIPNGGEIVNVTYSIVSENNYTRVDCFVESMVRLA